MFAYRKSEGLAATLAICIMVLAGCGGAQSADEAWTQLTSTDSAPTQQNQEGDLAFFLRAVEQADQERREEGLRFWKNHPDDARRYQWLMLTVHAPPRYARDLRTWSQAEASTPDANPAEIDSRSQAKWDQAYPEMREAFWSAPSTTDLDRRFLWSGELEEGYERLRDAHARGETADLTALNESLVRFLGTYRGALDESDRTDYAATVQRPIMSALHAATAIGGDAMRSALVNRLVASGNRVAVSLAPSYSAEIGTSSYGQEPWFRIFHGLGIYATGSKVGLAAFRRDDLIYRWQVRDEGIRLWPVFPDNGLRASWLSATIDQAPQFTTRVEEAMDAFSTNTLGPFLDDDPAWKARSNAIVQERLREYLAKPEVSVADRGLLVGANLRARLREEAPRLRQHDRVAVDAFLRDLTRYNTTYADDGLNVFLINSVLRDYPRWGVSDQQVREAFAPLARSANADIREIPESVENRIRARSVPVEFKAQTLAGAPFDLADLRGKIVLVDHWATTCSSCIAAMPRISEIYQRYRERGFEVVSIAYDGRQQEGRVRRIERELDLQWTTVAGDGLWDGVATKYGYGGFPQYMLLNRDGTLYAGSAEVDMGRGLEALLDEMLAAEDRAKRAPRPS